MLYIDPVGAIMKMHREGTRRVPYQVFMTCFTKLVRDPGGVDPLPPSDDLKGYFRAACMSVDLGIADLQERGDSRKKEFYEHIYPEWRKALPESEFRPYQEILDGKVRERLERERREREKREAEETGRKREEEREKASADQRRAVFERLTQAALREADAEEEAGEEAATAVISPSPEHHNVEELANAVGQGEIAIWYSDPAGKKPYAYYQFRKRKVAVQLVKTRHTHCVAVRYPIGFARQVGAGVIIKKMMEKWGYQERKPFSYFKGQYFSTFRVRIGSTSTNVIQQRQPEYTVHALAQTVRAVHAELVRILNGLEQTWPERPEGSEGEETPE